MPTLILPANRREFFLDKDGLATAYKDFDSTQVYTIDLRRLLGSDRIVSFETEVSGVTLDSSVATEKAINLVVSGSGGYVKLTVTTARGNVIVRRVQFLDRVS